MITVYTNGEEFLKDNSSYLDENRYMSVFFYLDAPLINEVNKINYMLKASNGDKKLLAIKLEPFNLILYGNKDCLEELLSFSVCLTNSSTIYLSSKLNLVSIFLTNSNTSLTS